MNARRCHQSPEEAMLYWTECALATLSGMRLRKSTSKADLRRYESIALGMLDDLALFSQEQIHKILEQPYGCPAGRVRDIRNGTRTIKDI